MFDPMQEQILNQIADMVQNEIEVKGTMSLDPNAVPGNLETTVRYTGFISTMQLTPAVEDARLCAAMAEVRYIELIKHLAGSL